MILHSPADLKPLAEQLVGRLPPGSLLLLDGPMGSGKTTLVSNLAVALGSRASVSSPTYTLIHEYPSDQGTLVHIDAWRLDDPKQLLESGLDDYLDNARLVVVEWGAGLLELYPQALLVRLGIGEDGLHWVRIGDEK